MLICDHWFHACYYMATLKQKRLCCLMAQSAGAVGIHCISATGYDTKQSDGESSVILELYGIQSTPSLPLLPDPLWP